MLSWIVGGQTYQLDDRDATNFLNNVGTGLLKGCYELGHDGLGQPPMHVLSERGPLQDGITYRGYRLDERLIMVSIKIKGTSVEDYYLKRQMLDKIFRPSNTLRKFRWTQGSLVRQEDAICIGGLEWAATGRQHLVHSAVLTLLCPDPRWYDPTINLVEIGLGGGSGTFEIPFTIPFEVGASTIDTTHAINYAGNVKSYPTIRITGPITNAYIENEELGVALDFDGYTISAGDYYEIDLGYADNTVVDSTGANKKGELSNDSDLVGFYIDPEVGGGVNTLRVTGSAISEATKISVSYYDYYIGV
jgi:hypothetical protein